MIIFTKFHKDRRKIEDFLLHAKFWAKKLFFCSPSKYVDEGRGDAVAQRRKSETVELWYKTLSRA